MLKLLNINKTFGEKSILTNINLDILSGKTYVILGPSGVGKSTLLNIIAGLVNEYTGEVINNFGSISYSFQEGRLIPWLSVQDNFYYIMQKKIDISYYLKIFNIEHLQFSLVKTLSGGEKQRVSIARAFLNNPALILMDENLSSLNLKMKFSIIKEMNIHLKKNNQTLIYVSHNIDEALLLADKVIILNDNGQIDSTLDICMNKEERPDSYEQLASYEKTILKSIMK